MSNDIERLSPSAWVERFAEQRNRDRLDRLSGMLGKPAGQSYLGALQGVQVEDRLAGLLALLDAQVEPIRADFLNPEKEAQKLR